MSLGKRIKLHRKEIGYTQGELAEILGVSVQAVSKWETDICMPDIIQIVPLSKTLGVSTDILLGNTDDDIGKIVSEIENCFDGEFCSSGNQAKYIYEKAKPYYDKYPANPKLAYFCLQSLSALIKNIGNNDVTAVINESNRYMSCIERYETNTDRLFKSYYVMSNTLRKLGAEEQANKLMDRIPDTFGDKLYWEAEVEFYNGNYEKALSKCKESFATKARYVSRCIRLARWINEKSEGAQAARKQLEYSKYMLTMINAFLSGGDYIPHRMAYQKITLLCGLVQEYIVLKEYNNATDCAKAALQTWLEFKKVQDNTSNYSSLLFSKEDDDGWWEITDKKFKEYWEITLNRLKAVDKIKCSPTFKELTETQLA